MGPYERYGSKMVVLDSVEGRGRGAGRCIKESKDMEVLHWKSKGSALRGRPWGRTGLRTGQSDVRGALPEPQGSSGDGFWVSFWIKHGSLRMQNASGALPYS